MMARLWLGVSLSHIFAISSGGHQVELVARNDAALLGTLSLVANECAKGVPIYAE